MAGSYYATGRQQYASLRANLARGTGELCIIIQHEPLCYVTLRYSEPTRRCQFETTLTTTHGARHADAALTANNDADDDEDDDANADDDDDDDDECDDRCDAYKSPNNNEYYTCNI